MGARVSSVIETVKEGNCSYTDASDVEEQGSGFGIFRHFYQ